MRSTPRSGSFDQMILGTAPGLGTSLGQNFSLRVHYSQEPPSISCVAATAASVPDPKAPALDRIDFLHRDAGYSLVVWKKPADPLDGFDNEEFISRIGVFFSQRPESGSLLQQLIPVYTPSASRSGSFLSPFPCFTLFYIVFLRVESGEWSSNGHVKFRSAAAPYDCRGTSDAPQRRSCDERRVALDRMGF